MNESSRVGRKGTIEKYALYRWKFPTKFKIRTIVLRFSIGMAMRSKEQILRSFIDVTGCDPRRAQNFLRAVDWNEQDAAALFFDTNETEQPSSPSPDLGESPLEDPSSYFFDKIK